MVTVNEMYELKVFPSDWNSIVNQFITDKEAGRDTILERNIAGESVRCMVTGYTWRHMNKPSAPQKQKILVQII